MAKDFQLITLRTDINPWEQQEPRETGLMFGRFKIFRDLGPESDRLRQTLEVLNSTGDKITYSTLKDYSSAFRWAARASAWDRYNKQADVARMVRRRRRMIDDQVKAAERLRVKAMEALVLVDPHDLTAGDIVRFVELSHKIESSIYRDFEEPTINAADGKAPEDISALSPADRRKRLEGLLSELGSRAVRAVDDDEVVA